MSDWGTEMDNIIALVRLAITNIPSGSVGAERGVRDGADLDEGSFPHLFVYLPETQEVEIDFLQWEVRTTYAMELWVEDTQENLAAMRDDIRTQIVADPTLGGAVGNLRMISSSLLEISTDTDFRRVLVAQFETFRVEG